MTNNLIIRFKGLNLDKVVYFRCIKGLLQIHHKEKTTKAGIPPVAYMGLSESCHALAE